MKICFVSYEIHPTTPGGCGVLLHNAAHILLQQNHRVIFLLDIPPDKFEHFQQFDRPALPNSQMCWAYHVESLCADLPLSADNFDGNEFLWRSYRVHFALKKLVVTELPDIVEFFDFTGVAYTSLLAKITQQCYPNSRLVIRLHNSLELIDREESTKSHNFEQYLAYAVEHSALRLAETILYPSEAYLTRSYRPYYEAWLGQTVPSKPPLVDHPRGLGKVDAPNLVLFYGRLYGFKGVDLFVDAAVSLLHSSPDAALKFVLVGHDSRRAPDGSPTYQEYLVKKIPARFLDKFDFKGHLNWDELTALLPNVLFAVFPSFIESFAYAAHELYAAGIPLIVNDIPAFADYFTHTINALVFDGTITDLTRQMLILATDKPLRQKITAPYSLAELPLGDFYADPFRPTWIKMDDTYAHLPSILVCILETGRQDSARTLDMISGQLSDGAVIVIFKPANLVSQFEDTGVVWLFGQSYRMFDDTGQPVAPTRLTTLDTLLLLKAGDIVQNGYIKTCLQTLARQPELAFVGCWKKIKCDDTASIDAFPFDAALELLPVRKNLRWFNRAVMRTPPGKLLIDLFQPALAEFAEIGYLWQLEDKIGPGVVIPEALIEIPTSAPAVPANPNLISYLILRNASSSRQRRLARYLVSYLLESDTEIPADLSDRVLVQRLSAELEAMRSTKGWRMLEKYWTLRDALVGLLRPDRRKSSPNHRQ